LFDDHQGRLSDFIQERERAYVISSIKKQIAQGNKEVFESYSLRTKSGNYIVVEDKRKIIDQDDGTKTMLCSLTNVTKKYHNPEEL
jgi:hypothetical protein